MMRHRRAAGYFSVFINLSERFMLGITIALCAIAISIFAVGIQIFTLRRVLERYTGISSETQS